MINRTSVSSTCTADISNAYAFASVRFVELYSSDVKMMAHAARADDGVDYVVVFQSDDAADFGVDLATLPPLPPNVHLVHHANRCFDVGTFGELLGGLRNSTPLLDVRGGDVPLKPLSSYEFFCVINSSVRGPFLPAWFGRLNLHWLQPFLAAGRSGRPTATTRTPTATGCRSGCTWAMPTSP